MTKSAYTILLSGILTACAVLFGCKEVDQMDNTAVIQYGDTDMFQQSGSDSVEHEATDSHVNAAVMGTIPVGSEDVGASLNASISYHDDSGIVNDLLADMTLKDKIYQMFIVTPESLTGIETVIQAGETTKAALREQPVGGIIYFSANLESYSQTQEMIAVTQCFAKESKGIGLFIAVDEEGGTVARVADQLGTTSFSDMAVYGAQNDGELAYTIGQTIGSDISALGFNVDFAPVADVNICSGNELGNRIFSDDPNVVANMVSNMVKGLQESGVSATLKHFPGLGAENGNTHYDDAVVIDRSLDELRGEEFVPFSAGIEAGADFVMVGHQAITGLDGVTPADLSYAVVTELLKEELAFTGLAVSDSHRMNTITANYSSGQAAVKAIQAGIDIVLMPQNLSDAVSGVYDAVQSGTISEDRIDESVRKILMKKEKMGLLLT